MPYDRTAPRQRRSILRDGVITKATALGLKLSEVLTEREILCVLMASEGLQNKEIAHEMLVGEATIKQSFERMYRRTGMKNRAQLVAQYVRENG